VIVGEASLEPEGEGDIAGGGKGCVGILRAGRGNSARARTELDAGEKEGEREMTAEEPG
jgi:hypothetical protein